MSEEVFRIQIYRQILVYVFRKALFKIIFFLNYKLLRDKPIDVFFIYKSAKLVN